MVTNMIKNIDGRDYNLTPVEFIEGDWVVNINNVSVLVTKVVSNITNHTSSIFDNAITLDHINKIKQCYRLATNDEIRDYLISKAKLRDYKVGTIIKSLYNTSDNLVCVEHGNTYYDRHYDHLRYHNVVIFKQGQWAEIVKPYPIIEVGDWIDVRGKITKVVFSTQYSAIDKPNLGNTIELHYARGYTKATKLQIRDHLVELATSKGYGNISTLTYVMDTDRLINEDGIIYDNGKWLEATKEANNKFKEGQWVYNKSSQSVDIASDIGTTLATALSTCNINHSNYRLATTGEIIDKLLSVIKPKHLWCIDYFTDIDLLMINHLAAYQQGSFLNKNSFI